MVSLCCYYIVGCTKYNYRKMWSKCDFYIVKHIETIWDYKNQFQNKYSKYNTKRKIYEWKFMSTAVL